MYTTSSLTLFAVVFFSAVVLTTAEGKHLTEYCPDAGSIRCTGAPNGCCYNYTNCCSSTCCALGYLCCRPVFTESEVLVGTCCSADQQCTRDGQCERPSDDLGAYLPQLVALALLILAICFCGCCWFPRRGSSSEETEPFFMNTNYNYSPKESKGVTCDELESNCPVIVFNQDIADVTPVTECCICLGDFVEGEQLRKLPGCGHLFHISCIDKWLEDHKTCPLCVQSVVFQLPSTPVHEHISIN
eukprot:TRINITY_DN12894_c0_g1_i1.p1 TRINITY_DN12894_c0_g1~~TRINITY_DN12894_c0_g1_i1.p1  ORF type:complete len:244 (-),score=27.75 TRINITY_DN12894_c0_g1_i1:79-810(-)